MNGIRIRPALPDDLAAVADLRWRWAEENHRAPVTTRDEFVRHFVTWAKRNAESHRCTVVVRDGVVVGMAWLATVRRVPHPHALERASGDVQCVYVTPDERDGGLGSMLIEAVLAIARDLGLERVTVHSSDRAVSAYTRHGFEQSLRLLQIKVARTRT